MFYIICLYRGAAYSLLKLYFETVPKSLRRKKYLQLGHFSQGILAAAMLYSTCASSLPAYFELYILVE